jgi:hypothetical protein
VPLPYLEIDHFLETATGAQAIATAIELGLIDTLAAGSMPAASLVRQLRVEGAGLDVLLGLLQGNGVVARDVGGSVRLTDRFAAALAYRDLLDAKLDFLRVSVPDFLLGLTDLVKDQRRFMAQSRLFKAFGLRLRARCRAGGREHGTHQPLGSLHDRADEVRGAGLSRSSRFFALFAVARCWRQQR